MTENNATLFLRLEHFNGIKAKYMHQGAKQTSWLPLSCCCTPMQPHPDNHANTPVVITSPMPIVCRETALNFTRKGSLQHVACCCMCCTHGLLLHCYRYFTPSTLLVELLSVGIQQTCSAAWATPIYLALFQSQSERMPVITES